MSGTSDKDVQFLPQTFEQLIRGERPASYDKRIWRTIHNNPVMSNYKLSELLYLAATLLLSEVTAALQGFFAANRFATPDNVGAARYQIQVHEVAGIPVAVAVAEFWVLTTCFVVCDLSVS